MLLERLNELVSESKRLASQIEENPLGILATDLKKVAFIFKELYNREKGRFF
jgi:hypothetical protein